MACELADDTCWPAFLAARTLLRSGVPDLQFVLRGHEWSCVPANGGDLRDAQQVLAASIRSVAQSRPQTTGAACAWTVYAPRGDGVPDFVHPSGQPVAGSVLAMARVYLPVLFLAARAWAEDRVFVAGHVTQTLDGRIACANGQSQWIGNEADLRHTHRMRALLDGVVIGAGTALVDDPRLTVRHVRGPDPLRIVLSGSGRVLGAGRPLHVFAPPGGIVVVGEGTPVPAAHASTRIVQVAKHGDTLAPRAVLDALRGQGVHSIYLEGGACALSSFLEADCIDLLQVHVASILLGSGLPSFRLPPVDHVRHALSFSVDHVMLDGHVLLSCWPQRGPRH